MPSSFILPYITVYVLYITSLLLFALVIFSFLTPTTWTRFRCLVSAWSWGCHVPTFKVQRSFFFMAH